MLSFGSMIKSSWRQIGRALLLGLFVLGQGRLTFHYHVDVHTALNSKVLISADKTIFEAPCRMCELASQTRFADLNLPAVVAAPSRAEVVNEASRTAVAIATLIRLAARAPPVC